MKKTIKKYVKKYLDKYLGEDLATIDSRLVELELKTGIKTLAQIDPLWYGEMAVNDAKHVKPDVPEAQLTELHDRCFFKIDIQHVEILNDYLRRNKDIYRHYNQFWKTTAGYYFRVITKEYSGSHSFTPELLESEINRGYTEISFSDFEKLVLKKEQPEKPEQLEIGKWYKNTAGNLLFCFTGEYDFEKDPLGYGFVDGTWRDENSIGWTDVNIPATNEEVEKALISEAKRRGFKKGVEIKDLHTKTKGIINRVYYCDDSADLRTEKRWGLCIYHNGKWTEIISESKKEIDWSVPGQFVSYDGDYAVIVTTGESLKCDLSGINVFSGSNILTKEFRNDWICDNFKPFTGQLTLKN